jgi:hypothetical protein
MQSLRRILLLTPLICVGLGRAQTPAPIATPVTAQVIVPPLARISDPSVWRQHNRKAVVADGDSRKGVQLDTGANDGMAWLLGSDFGEGMIEVDLRGADKPGQSFVGIAFRGMNDTTYDAVYFRAFNFKNPDVPRRARAVQYISQPEFTWEKLRAQFPGKYESAVHPVPEPDSWFHARIVVAGRQVSVFVNDAAEPSLVVTELSERRGGLIGLWVGNGSAGDFASLKITPLSHSAK